MFGLIRIHFLIFSQVQFYAHFIREREKTLIFSNGLINIRSNRNVCWFNKRTRTQWTVMILNSLPDNIVRILYGDDKLSLGNERGERENKGKDIPLV